MGTGHDIMVSPFRRHTKMGKSMALSLLSLPQVRSRENAYSLMAISIGVGRLRIQIYSYMWPSLISSLRKGVLPVPQLNPKKKIFETIQPGIYLFLFNLMSLKNVHTC